MAHRTIVAYRRDAGSFDLHYAHDGRTLTDRIDPAHPFGGPGEWPGDTTHLDRLGLSVRGGYRSTAATAIEPLPLATRVDAGTVLTTLDESIESLVVVSRAFDATTFLVCSLVVAPASWPARSDDGEDDHGGDDLVVVDPDGTAGSVRDWFVRAKSTLSVARADETISEPVARELLCVGLERRGTIWPRTDPSFLLSPG